MHAFLHQLRVSLSLHFRNRMALVRSRIGFVIRTAQEPHGLPGPLVVSITSYPKRFKTLAFTLRSLLRGERRRTSWSRTRRGLLRSGRDLHGRDDCRDTEEGNCQRAHQRGA